MTVVGDGRGHFIAKCRYALRFDQTERPPVLASLDAVLSAFPVKGSASG